MHIAVGIKALLTGNAGLSALVNTRVYSMALPRTYTFPVICFHVFNVTQPYAFDGESGLLETEFQVDCYATDPDSAHSISEAVKSALRDYADTLSSGQAVKGTFLEREMDMPVLADATNKSTLFRTLLQFRFVHAN
jgi:hypothetical protein